MTESSPQNCSTSSSYPKQPNTALVSLTLRFIAACHEMVQPSDKQSAKSWIKIEVNKIWIQTQPTIQSFLVSVQAETATES